MALRMVAVGLRVTFAKEERSGMQLLIKYTVNLGFLLVCLCCGMARAQQGKFQTLPDSAWTYISSAQGILVGGDPHAQPNIQVIFDANCPYCAKLYTAMHKDHPNVSVRWVPVAYFWADSAALEAAILQADDPVASLDTNFRHYVFSAKHGGYSVPKDRPFHLAAKNVALRREWEKWGAFTPMIVIRTKNGKILQAGGFSDDLRVLGEMLDLAAPTNSFKLRAYEESASRKGTW